MKKIAERWQLHHLEVIVLGAGQLDIGQRDQALSIHETCTGFKCPPVKLQSLAWQAPKQQGLIDPSR